MNQNWITEVNGKPTPNLDELLRVVRDIGQNDSVRVRSVDLQGKTKASLDATRRPPSIPLTHSPWLVVLRRLLP